MWLVGDNVNSDDKRDRIASLWRLAEKITAQLKADSRVESVWVWGSLARDEADRFSDLDLAALIDVNGYSQFMRESRKDMWLGLDVEWRKDSWGDSCITKNVPFHVDYLTPERIHECEWEELEYAERILGGIIRSKPMYDPKGTLEALKRNYSVYPEQLRKRRILKADDDAAMYAFWQNERLRESTMSMLPNS